MYNIYTLPPRMILETILACCLIGHATNRNPRPIALWWHPPAKSWDHWHCFPQMHISPHNLKHRQVNKQVTSQCTDLPIPPSVSDGMSFCNATSPIGASLSASLGVVVDDVAGGSLFSSWIIFFSRIPTICFYISTQSKQINKHGFSLLTSGIQNIIMCRHSKNKGILPSSSLVLPGMLGLAGSSLEAIRLFRHHTCLSTSRSQTSQTCISFLLS